MARLAPRPSPLPSAPRAAGRPSPLDGVQHIVLDGISWSVYEGLLADVADRPLRLTYDQGRLEIMSPLPEHERAKKIIARMIEALSVDLGIEVGSLGSTTFKREDARKGLEPDECYYFRGERAVRGLRAWHPKRDPPPELVVEVDITRRSVDREPVYAAIGVPEIWRWDGKRLTCLELADGAYRARATSLAFPFLAPAKLTRFVHMREKDGENETLRKFRAWVKRLLPKG